MKITASTIILVIITPFALVVTALTGMDGALAFRKWWRGRHAFSDQVSVEEVLRIEARLKQLWFLHGRLTIKQAKRQRMYHQKHAGHDVLHADVVTELDEYIDLLQRLRSYKKVKP